MSKIYEALGQAQKEKKETSSPSGAVLLHFPNNALRFPTDSETEKEMLNLYQNIESLLPNTPKKVIQFIGTREGEGTSTVVRDFGCVIAGRLRKPVLILDTDQRNPRQHLFFGITPTHCFEDVVRNARSLGTTLYQIGDSKLSVSLASRNAAFASQFFLLPVIKDFMEDLRKRFEFVLVDSPPASLSPDGLSTSRNVDGVVMILEAEKTRWPVAENLKDNIVKRGGTMLGVVLNKRRHYIPASLYKRL